MWDKNDKRRSLTDTRALETALIRAGYYDTRIHAMAHLLNVNVETYAKKRVGFTRFNVGEMAELAVRCSMNIEQFAWVFCGYLFNEDGTINAEHAKELMKGRIVEDEDKPSEFADIEQSSKD